MVDQAEIQRKSLSDKLEDRREAADQIGNNFADLPDKDDAWQHLIRLMSDEDYDVRVGAACALGSAFSAVPDKEAAWQDLHRLTGDDDSFVRLAAAAALDSSL